MKPTDKELDAIVDADPCTITGWWYVIAPLVLERAARAVGARMCKLSVPEYPEHCWCRHCGIVTTEDVVNTIRALKGTP